MLFLRLPGSVFFFHAAVADFREIRVLTAEDAVAAAAAAVGVIFTGAGGVGVVRSSF